MVDAPQISAAALASMDEPTLRAFTGELLERIQRADREIAWRTAKIDQLTFEMAQLKRVRFGRKSELLDADQRALFDEAVDADIAALQAQLDELAAAAAKADEPSSPPADSGKRQPKRAALPAHLPRVERHHEPEHTACACGCAMKRIGEDVSEKLDDTPGVFTVERHVRGKWACAACTPSCKRRCLQR